MIICGRNSNFRKDYNNSVLISPDRFAGDYTLNSAGSDEGKK
jgi:hypothetical protein